MHFLLPKLKLLSYTEVRIRRNIDYNDVSINEWSHCLLTNDVVINSWDIIKIIDWYESLILNDKHIWFMRYLPNKFLFEQRFPSHHLNPKIVYTHNNHSLWRDGGGRGLQSVSVTPLPCRSDVENSDFLRSISC